MTTDRELLELAAKAAGIRIKFFNSNGQAIIDQDGGGPESCLVTMWNPRVDDGQTMRLANTLKIDIIHHPTMILCRGWEPGQDVHVQFFDGDRNKAVRQAVLEAAAQIGRKLANRPVRCQAFQDRYCMGTGIINAADGDRPCDGIPF